MTAQTLHHARAVQTPAPSLTESAQAAHFRAYATKHGPRYRRAALLELRRTMLGALAVAFMIVLTGGLFSLLDPADAHALAGMGIVCIVGAFVVVSIYAARRRG